MNLNVILRSSRVCVCVLPSLVFLGETLVLAANDFTPSNGLFYAHQKKGNGKLNTLT